MRNMTEREQKIVDLFLEGNLTLFLNTVLRLMIIR